MHHGHTTALLKRKRRILLKSLFRIFYYLLILFFTKCPVANNGSHNSLEIKLEMWYHMSRITSIASPAGLVLPGLVDGCTETAAAHQNREFQAGSGGNKYISPPPPPPAEEKKWKGFVWDGRQTNRPTHFVLPCLMFLAGKRNQQWCAVTAEALV